MNAQLVQAEEFFAPSQFGALDLMIERRERTVTGIRNLANLVLNDKTGAMVYLLRGADLRHSPEVSEVFKVEPAIKALDAAMWWEAMNMTDVYTMMPETRRNEWRKSIESRNCPEFIADNVVPTFQGLLDMRSQFLAEKVDGLFRSLSGTHVTNSPMAFGKRMIITGVASDWGSYAYNKAGYINDLRQIISKFLGFNEERFDTINDVRKMVRGQWYSLDGGALRIRVYQNTNAHLEVHPDMAWRLNAILANLHPRVIPANARQKPVKVAKEWSVIERPLPREVLRILSDLRWQSPDQCQFGFHVETKTTAGEAAKVLEYLGGVMDDGRFVFDYPARYALNDVVISGRIPDYKSHQYYPTPESIARDAVEVAGIWAHHTVLEPSAGQGAIADLIPSANLTCVELSRLHSKVLETKGCKVINGDFLEHLARYDRIVMNPPYSEGRWNAHLQHAAKLLEPEGVLVAILPASQYGKNLVDGKQNIWHSRYSGEFANTGIEVAILEVRA